jgi:hypothetical protein
MPVGFTVNGKPVEVDVEPRTSLADCLRHALRLTGTHVGCEHGVCGACTVIVDGAAVRSCLMLAVQAEGSSIVTVEGLSQGDGLTPLQTAFRKHHAFAMRVLHVGHADHRACPVERGTRRRRGAHPLGIVGKSVPLHRLHPDRQGRARCARRVPQGR